MFKRNTTIKQKYLIKNKIYLIYNIFLNFTLILYTIDLHKLLIFKWQSYPFNTDSKKKIIF